MNWIIEDIGSGYLYVVGQIEQISTFVLPPKYMRGRRWHNIGYKEYVVGEARVNAFNPGLMHKLIV